MTAGPSDPGVVPRRYQPALSVSRGTSIAPSESSPRVSSVYTTPSRGMEIVTGGAAGRVCPVTRSAVPVRRVPAGSGSLDAAGPTSAREDSGLALRPAGSRRRVRSVERDHQERNPQETCEPGKLSLAPPAHPPAHSTPSPYSVCIYAPQPHGLHRSRAWLPLRRSSTHGWTRPSTACATIGGMSRVVHLHIGAPKTGTTYLQHRLSRNARALAKHDVHIPTRSPLVSPELFQFRAALDLLGQDWGGSPATPTVRGPARAPAAQQERHQHRQPRDPRAGVARGDRQGDARPRRLRGARRLLRPRPRPRAAGRLAGEHQAGPQVGLPAVPQPGRVRQAVVLPRLRPADGADQLERGRRARAGPPGHRAAARRRPGRAVRPFCTAFGIDPEWAPSTATGSTPRSASRRPR